MSVAHASLLLVLHRRRNAPFRAALAVTVGAVGLVALLVTLPLLTDGRVPGDWGDYWRLFGVVAILDALGSIVLPVAARFVRDETAADTARDAAAPARATLVLSLPTGVAALLAAAAERAGVSPERAAVSAIERAVRAPAVEPPRG